MKRNTLSYRLLTVLVNLLAAAVLGTLGCSSSSSNPVSAGLDFERNADNMQVDLSAWPIDGSNPDPPGVDEIEKDTERNTAAWQPREDPSPDLDDETENPKLDDETENPKG